MPIPTPKLRVYANPYFHIDHLGRPAGAVVVPHYLAAVRDYVGACLTVLSEIAKAPTVKIGDRTFETGAANHDRQFAFAAGIVEIPNIPEFRMAVKGGELVAADAPTAAICGLVKFEKPEDALRRLKAEGIVEFDSRNGEGAFAYFGKQEPLALVAPSAEAAAVSRRAQPAPAKADV